ncbi:hypothetical protein C5167_043678 [Papaver somniferum]|uniref:Uncharacterized protein n=1 Tax=Papaver somniferum TaxID=3469 RepID=A0A4Y7LAA0_PAPSO|nr:hypothetical protein C5167_043678 [Papaver somniferum]
MNCRPEDLHIPFERSGQVRDVYLPKDFYSGMGIGDGGGGGGLRVTRVVQDPMYASSVVQLPDREMFQVNPKEFHLQTHIYQGRNRCCWRLRGI